MRFQVDRINSGRLEIGVAALTARQVRTVAEERHCFFGKRGHETGIHARTEQFETRDPITCRPVASTDLSADQLDSSTINNGDSERWAG